MTIKRNHALGTLVMACGLSVAWVHLLRAESLFSIFSTPPSQQTESLSHTPDSLGARREKRGTAFFVDDSGHLLTAGHAAKGCARIVVSKEGNAVLGRVVAISNRVDLALIKVPKTLGLSAVFPRSVTAAVNDMVFAAAYDTLPKIVARGGLLANAMVSPNGTEAGYIAISSDVTFGASGAPVLDSRGLVQGIISRRTASDHVLAVNAAEAKAFLAANHVTAEEDDRPQIAAAGSRADRAASISARIVCLQN